MTTQELREKILHDDDFLQHHIEAIIQYYNLKHVPRWAIIRTQDEVESVAEHIYGMHILISYFLPLINEALDVEVVRQLATWHDMAEALVGDMTSVSKTESHKIAEKHAEEELVRTAPLHLRNTLDTIYKTFDEKSTREAEFVKAIDKIEPMFHLYFLSKKAGDLHTKFDLVWTAEAYQEYRRPYIEKFDVIKRFDDKLYELNKKFHPTGYEEPDFYK